MQSSSDPTEITELGRLLSKIPIDPKYAKMLVVATKYNISHFAIMMVACMSVQEVFDDSMFKEELPDKDNESEKELDEDEKLLETQIDRNNKKALVKKAF